MYLIGDAGIAESSPLEPSLALLESKLEEADAEKSSVIFLGDNIYPSGLREIGHPKRPQDEKRIKAQMDILENYQGRVVFIAGNHDWFEGKTEGDEYIDRQARYVEEYLGRGDTFLPSGGCPGPVEIDLTDELVWIIFDSQWWLHAAEPENTMPPGCEINSDEALLDSVDAMLNRNRDKQVIISTHHPLYSNGRHGGYFSLKDHIFPLTAIHPYLYLPLPLIGSVYPLYRKTIGNIQDITHARYTDLKDGLTPIFNQYENLIYAAGHEHNLQYQKHNKTHYIVSGSGSKQGYLRDNENLIYGRATKGFAVLKSYASGDVWLEFYAPIAENPEEPMYRQKIIDRSIKSSHEFL